MNNKTSLYFEAISEHVVLPLQHHSVAEHCFAAALLLFGAIDGLGRLVHSNPNAGAGRRFQEYLPRLGNAYALRAKSLWKLRNSLAHNSLNVAAFLSQAVNARLHHLEEDRGYIFVHTRQLAVDFERAFRELKMELLQYPELGDQVEGRLGYAELTDPIWRLMEVKTTEPLPIRFVQGPED